MKIGKVELNVRYRRTWLSLAGLVVVLLGVLVVWSIFHQSKNPRSKPAPQPPVARQPLKPSSYEQTRRLFGPWHLAPAHTTGAPRLVMLRASGGTDVSSKVVRIGKDWKIASAFEIDAVVVRPDKVIIRTSESQIYDLQYRQAFILSQRPDAVYGFVRNGPGKALLVSTTVSALKKH